MRPDWKVRCAGGLKPRFGDGYHNHDWRSGPYGPAGENQFQSGGNGHGRQSKSVGFTPTLAGRGFHSGDGRGDRFGFGQWKRAGAETEQAAGTPPGSNSVGARVYNIRDFGAKGDGTTLDTAAIQAAIDACTGDHGGTVLVPAGTFLISPIELKSNITLHIAAGGTLLATTDAKQYHPARGIPLNGDHTMGDGNVGLVYGAEAENITIEGPGTIDGQGAEVPRRRFGRQ